MTRKMVFMTEEASMEEFLGSFLPRILPPDWQWQCISHQGKSDLEQSIPRKLRAWQEPDVQFFVIRDQDNSDCKIVKKRLQVLCKEGFRPETVIRIACREMESWFLGDLKALGEAFEFNKLAQRQKQAKYRHPDVLVSPSREIKQLIPKYQKRSGAREIGKYISLDGNCSKSFNVFVEGIRKCVGC